MSGQHVHCRAAELRCCQINDRFHMQSRRCASKLANGLVMKNVRRATKIVHHGRRQQRRRRQNRSRLLLHYGAGATDRLLLQQTGRWRKHVIADHILMMIRYQLLARGRCEALIMYRSNDKAQLTYLNDPQTEKQLTGENRKWIFQKLTTK